MPCILCGVDRYAEIGEKGEFTIVKCADCELVYTIPIPAESKLIKLYNSWSRHDLNPAQSLSRRLKYRYTTSKIKKYFPRDKQIRLLEIGCSKGHLLDAVKTDKQIIATGIDLDEPSLDYAKSKGHKVFMGTVEALKFPDESFDAIVAIHVMEHLYNPVKTLAEIKRILSGGGILFSIVPCVTHIKARVAGIKWKYYSPPGHLWYFSPKTFSLLLQKAGFISVYSSCFYNRAHLKSVAKKL